MSAKFIACVFGVVVGLSGALRADQGITPPAVPTNLEVVGYKAFLKTRAVGTQNYICTPASTPTGGDWVFIGPQATLFDENLEQIGTHYQSRNPLRSNAIHATWQHSHDTSAVWATRRDGSMDADYVAPGAIEWLVLDVSGAQAGPTAGDKLTSAVFIQRVNTVGGIKPPATECTTGTLNTRKLVPYQADYYFYK